MARLRRIAMASRSVPSFVTVVAQTKRQCAWVPLLLGAWLSIGGSGLTAAAAVSLPGTAEWVMDGDIASELVDGVDRFLLAKLAESVDARASHWPATEGVSEEWDQALLSHRERLSHILGVRDSRVSFAAPELMARVGETAKVGEGDGFEVFRVRWPVLGDVTAEGLLLEPHLAESREVALGVVALPDADMTPEQLVGLTEGLADEAQFARRLAENGCRVLIPALISRQLERRNSPGRDGGARLSHREFLYRSAFELGRHVIGYEVQKVLAGVDWFAQQPSVGRIGVMGYGEGGMLALYSAALDPRIDITCVSGYFEQRERVWEQPISRNVFGLLERFGDAELGLMVAPRSLIVEASRGPEAIFPSEGGAPARLSSPSMSSVQAEFNRLEDLLSSRGLAPTVRLVGDGSGGGGSDEALVAFLEALDPGYRLRGSGPGIEPSVPLVDDFGEEARLRRQIHELDRHNQQLLVESPYQRQAFMDDLDTGSVEAFEASARPYRQFFHEEIIGRFSDAVMPFNARSRLVYDEEDWMGYELVLDVYPDVIAYGILCLPKDLTAGERRPVVVCQHGLEGRPRDIVEGDHRAYHDFAAKLAARGFVTFAPQNLYIFQDRFRTLQRKANPLKKTLFSVIVPQHQQIVDWLKTQPFVDPDRIGFYGLSYGGKTAMRVPAIVTDYCLSICSADFNEWVWKNASTRSPYSYVWTGEYEIFEFDLGSTFNYSEMAALIAPRPFMVERGHFDGVAPDETVASEFAKVRHLFSARLGLPDRCEIEWFVGPHTIHGEGTFEFLHRHLKWPR